MGVGGGGRVWERYCTAQSETKGSLICKVGLCGAPLFSKVSFGCPNTLLMLPIQVTSWKGLIVRRARHLGPAMTKPKDGKS